jgi:hypothetical protein
MGNMKFYIIIMFVILFNAAYALESDFLGEKTCLEQEENQESYKAMLVKLQGVLAEDIDEQTKLNNAYSLAKEIFVRYINVGHETMDNRMAEETQNDLLKKLQKIGEEGFNAEELMVRIKMVIADIENIERHDSKEKSKAKQFDNTRKTLMEKYSFYCAEGKDIRENKYFDKIKDCLERDREQYYKYPYGGKKHFKYCAIRCDRDDKYTLCPEICRGFRRENPCGRDECYIGRYADLFVVELLGAKECEEIHDVIQRIISTIEKRSQEGFWNEFYNFFHSLDDCDQYYDRFNEMALVSGMVIVTAAILYSVYSVYAVNNQGQLVTVPMVVENLQAPANQ